jgi:DNA-directed RNA polymerase subunit K/omega
MARSKITPARATTAPLAQKRTKRKAVPKNECDTAMLQEVDSDTNAECVVGEVVTARDNSYDFRFVHRSSVTPELPQADGSVGAPNRITPPFLTKYEFARAVGARASMIAKNEPLLIDAADEYDPILIAEKEMRAGLSPLIVRRYLPHHTDARPCYEDWDVQELLSSTAGPHPRWYGVPPP